MQETKDSEERKNEFIDVAEKLFKENGIVDTTVNSIVKDMDVAKGLFYYYFKSKDDVISDKYNQVFNEMMKREMDIQPSYQDRLNQFITNCVRSFRQLNSEFPPSKIDLSKLKNRSLQEAKTVSIEGLTTLFKEGIEKKELNFVHPEYYADILISGINTLIQEGKAEDEEIIAIILDLIERSGKD